MAPYQPLPPIPTEATRPRKRPTRPALSRLRSRSLDRTARPQYPPIGLSLVRIAVCRLTTLVRRRGPLSRPESRAVPTGPSPPALRLCIEPHKVASANLHLPTPPRSAPQLLLPLPQKRSAPTAIGARAARQCRPPTALPTPKHSLPSSPILLTRPGRISFLSTAHLVQTCEHAYESRVGRDGV